MSSRTKRIAAPWFAVVAISILLLFFQNCTASSPFQAATSNPSAKGNGTGYEGKPYYNLDVTSECTDGNSIKSRIEVNEDGSGRILRSNCVDLDKPQLIRPGEATRHEIFGQAGFAVIYDHRLFILQASDGDPSSEPVLLAYCRAMPTVNQTLLPTNPISRGELAVFGTVGTGESYAVTRFTYAFDQPMLISSARPKSLTGTGTCEKDKVYRSEELHGQFDPLAKMNLFSHGALPNSALQVTRIVDPMVDYISNAAYPEGGIPSVIHTNFFHNLVTAFGPRSDLACQSVHTNVRGMETQGPPIPAICYLHNTLPVQ